MVLDRLLERLAAAGLVAAGGKQRTDSTHVIAAVAALNRLELAGESVRALLEALAAAHPDWLGQRICLPDFSRRYGTPMTSWRPPVSAARRKELAIAYARDGYALLAAVYHPAAPPWLREIPAVSTLRMVLGRSGRSSGWATSCTSPRPATMRPPAPAEVASSLGEEDVWPRLAELAGRSTYPAELCRPMARQPVPSAPRPAAVGRPG